MKQDIVETGHNMSSLVHLFQLPVNFISINNTTTSIREDQTED